MKWPAELLNARVVFWQCPVEEHRNRSGCLTVQWVDGIAHCTFPDCDETSTPSQETQQ